MALDENVEIIEEEEIVDGEIRKIRKIIKTRVVQEVIVVQNETTTDVIALEDVSEENITTLEETTTTASDAVVIAAEETTELVVENTEEVTETTEVEVPEVIPAEEREEKESSIAEPEPEVISLLDQLLCHYITPTGEKKYCMITNNKDGTYMVDINATDTGMYTVDAELDGNRIPRAPFCVRIIQRTDSNKVLMYGEGLRPGVLGDFDSTVYVDTKGAGPGKLKVQIHGPKGGSTVTLKKEEKDDRLVRINYDPKVSGNYTINVLWSDAHITGSPCEVNVSA